MNNIVATSVQPDVAVRLIEAFADAATVQNSEDAMVMDWLKNQDPEFWTDILSEALNTDADEKTAKEVGTIKAEDSTTKDTKDFSDQLVTDLNKIEPVG